MKMTFTDTWSLSVREQKTKQSNKIECRWLWQVCMANADMGTPPRLVRRRVFQSWPTNARVSLKELSKTLVYETDAQWSHWVMQTWWRGPSRGNGMPWDPRIQCLVDPTSDCWVMSSCKSHENVFQGHLVTLSLGAKNQMEQQDCMLLAPTSV